MGDPIVMLGVGAAKSGTSWLHRYLSDHPECHFRAIKELHYFNSIDAGTMAENVARIEEMQARLQELAKTEKSTLGLTNKVRNVSHMEHYLEILALGQEDRAAYLEYLNEGRDTAKVVGELTPAYALLGSNRLSEMASIDRDVRFVYLMRDPVDRLWSHVRMIAKQRSKETHEFAERAANILSRVFRGKEDQIARRCDYAGALARLNKAVDPKKLFVGIFEEIFNGDMLAQLCKFLGISPMKPDFSIVVNAGNPLPMRPDQMAAAADWLSPQYEAVQHQFGKMPDSWTSSLARVS